MKIKYLFIGGLFLISPFFVSASADHVVISQVQVSGDGGASDEFIELYNPTSTAVDLSGWSLQYKSATGGFPLTGKRNLPAVSVPSGGYYLIGHSNYNGTPVADLIQGTISLSGSSNGATIFLSNSTTYLASCDDSSIVDKLAYGSGMNNCPETTSAPLPTQEQSLLRHDDTDNNSLDFSVSASSPRNLGSAGVPSPLEPEAKTAVPRQFTQSLIISEFLPNPEGADSGDEWVELFNPSNEIVELSGWKLDDKALSGDKVGVTAYVFDKEAKINPDSYLIVNLGEDNFGLSNFDGDELRLIYPDDTVAARVSYETDAPEEQSYSRRSDGSYAWTLEQTKNAPNQIENGMPVNPSVLGLSIPNGEVFVRIKAALPNPKGTDSGKEWVILENFGDYPLDLNGWILDDGRVEDKIGSSALTLGPLALDPKSETTVAVPAGKFALANTGEDHIRLFNPQKVLINEVGYIDAIEGKVLSFVAGPADIDKTVRESAPPELQKSAAEVATPGMDQQAVQKEEGSVAGAGSLPRTGPSNALYVCIFVFFGLVWYIYRANRNLKRSVSIFCER